MELTLAAGWYSNGGNLRPPDATAAGQLCHYILELLTSGYQIIFDKIEMTDSTASFQSQVFHCQGRIPWWCKIVHCYEERR